METALYAARFASYATGMVLFGGSLVRVLIGAHAAVIDRAIRPVQIAAAVLSLLAAIGWLMLEAASMGDGWGDAVAPDTLRLVLEETHFGHLWIARLLIGIILIPVAWRGGWPSVAVVAGLSLGMLADEGHAGIGTGIVGVFRVINQFIHLLAAGLWLGGLLPLVLLLSPGRFDEETVTAAVRRFSGLGYGAVTLVLATGCINSAIFLGAPGRLLDTPWGLTLLAKLGFVGLTLALALVNRTITVPSFRRDWPGARNRLQRTIYVEIVCGLAVLATVSVLGTLAPPVS